MSSPNMPPNWNPPAPAWEARWPADDEPLLAVYFGVQGAPAPAWQAWVRTELEHGACLSLERAAWEDLQGLRNAMYISYWRADAYHSWWRKASAWWASPEREAEGCGYWREVIPLPYDRFETLHSTSAAHGVSSSASELVGPILEHGYPGGARDRIPCSAHADLRSRPQTAAARATARRVLIRPPENLCVIRSGQDWSQCSAEERDYYFAHVQPVLLEGMRYLSEHPRESGCLSMRFVQEVDQAGEPLQRTSGIGFAVDIFAFEEWAKSHPTHTAIFDRFMDMVGRFGVSMRLQLWHEVSVMPARGAEFEYISCHPGTGLLSTAV